MTSRRDDIRLIQGGAEEVRPDAPPEREPPPAPERNRFLPDDCPVVALGVSGTTRYFLDEKRQLVSLETKELSQLNIRGLWGREKEQLYRDYPRVSKEGDVIGFRPEVAAEALICATNEAGVWKPQERLRGPGAWRGDDGELILHCGDRVLVFPRVAEAWGEKLDLEPGQIGRHVYPASERIPLPSPETVRPGPEGDAARTLAMLETWNFRRGSIDAVLLLGWIGAAMIGGALRWRPLAWLTGGQGTGKSTLHELLKLLFGDETALVAVSDASAAGLWQTLEQSTLPVAFDELEAEGDNRRQNGVVKLARQAASGGRVLRGGADHKSAEFKVRACFLFSSILIPPLLGQDLSRMAILELDELERGKAGPDLDTRAWRETGAALRRRLVDGWWRLDRTLEFYKASLAAKGLGARACDQFGALLACADVLLNDAEPCADSAGEWVDKFEASTSLEWEDSERDQDFALRHMLSSIVDVYRNGQRHSVANYVRCAASEDAADEPREANRILGTCGLRVMPAVVLDDGGRGPRHLAIANDHRGLAAIFKDTKWAGQPGAMGVWVQAFRRLAGAESSGKRTVRFADVVCKATLVPLEIVLPKETKEAAE